MTRLIAAALAAALTLVAPPVRAQSWPTQPVKIVVPFPAGGTTDILARLVADQLSAKWGQTVVVDNRGGASGTVGSEQVAKSPPDGYTLMITATHHVINPSLFKQLRYDTRADFTPLALIASVPNVLVVHPSLPAGSVQELIALARKEPGKLNFGSAGTGGANHLSGELFAFQTGIKITHVPYKGAAPALNDLLGGHIPMMFDSLPGVVSHIQAGNLRALGVTSRTRAAAAPDIPTLDEAGVKGFEATAWFGLYGPAKMPEAVVSKISADVREVLHSPAAQAKLKELGAEPGSLSQPAFAKFVSDEIDKWHGVVTKADIRATQ
ncbi:tripartite tricarboxylate transporter substrate binding protein [Rhodoplanes sp. TEM]|uniref:Tripartite tricarboxylate transporter substrate binding protein n=1 Tax=Rhodoplanes tepidamans TaxID=200616 RepID=A0ABT5JIW1_RHOTP|nr:MULTISPECIES: tripartite tricarboxylate transporter substrate binding protein [Rhodoplanes]MDC7789318.1 tripartite tricarboxylate transporter substrate binding protein [Rhodoplanes tepidamans]MDC7986007.1 tripartite tricarboxylate transporter substrate binding protein [Rhodoplanes sp. TEM]MDQ0359003.1 tripartite-type tricarboxylate transporter receptor subunit TctC [Rhodoplanes tepidamans]